MVKNIVLYENGIQKVKNSTKTLEEILTISLKLKQFGITELFVFQDDEELKKPVCYELNIIKNKITKQTIYDGENRKVSDELLAILLSWCSLYYLDYWDTDNNYSRLSNIEIAEIMCYKNIDEVGKIDDFLEYAYDNQKIGKNYVDDLFDKNSISIKKPMKIYRTFNWENDNKELKGYVSTTTTNLTYWNLDIENRHEFILPVGTKILPTRYNGIDYCDENEILVRLETLRKYKI